MTAPISAASHAQLGRIARGGALNLVGAFVSGISGFVLVVVVTNNFSAVVAGNLFAATSAAVVLAAVGSLGAETGLARFVLRYEAHDRRNHIPVLIGTALRPSIAVSTVAAVLLLVTAGHVAPLIGLDAGAGTTMLRVIAVALPFMTISDQALAATRAFGHMRPTVLIDRIVRSGAQPLAALVVGLAAGGHLALTVSWAAPYILSAVIAGVALRRLFRRRWATSTDVANDDIVEIRREFWSYTWPRGVARVCQIVIQRIDIVLIAAIMGPQDAAFYTAATRFVVLGQFGVQAIQNVLQPRFSALIAREEHDTVREVFKVSTAWSMALSWPLYVTIACSATLYLRIFGSSYQGSPTQTVVTMSIAMGLAVAAGPLDTLLLMAGRSTTSLVNALIAAVVNVGLCLALIPLWGISGAALAWGVAVVTRNGLAFWQVRGQLGLTPASRAAVIVAVAALACFGAPLLLVSAATGLTPLSFALTVTVGTAMYLATLWSARAPLALTAMRALFVPHTRATGGLA